MSSMVNEMIVFKITHKYNCEHAVDMFVLVRKIEDLVEHLEDNQIELKDVVKIERVKIREIKKV